MLSDEDQVYEVKNGRIDFLITKSSVSGIYDFDRLDIGHPLEMVIDVRRKLNVGDCVGYVEWCCDTCRYSGRKGTALVESVKDRDDYTRSVFIRRRPGW
jgi:hypothetical protein